MYIGSSQMTNECVAQLVEHLTFNQRAQGSNPCTLTIKKIPHLVWGYFLRDMCQGMRTRQRVRIRSVSEVDVRQDSPNFWEDEGHRPEAIPARSPF